MSNALRDLRLETQVCPQTSCMDYMDRVYRDVLNRASFVGVSSQQATGAGYVCVYFVHDPTCELVYSTELCESTFCIHRLSGLQLSVYTHKLFLQLNEGGSLSARRKILAKQKVAAPRFCSALMLLSMFLLGFFAAQRGARGTL